MATVAVESEKEKYDVLEVIGRMVRFRQLSQYSHSDQGEVPSVSFAKYAESRTVM